MGVAERKERHREDLKNEILKAARELFNEKGFEATSMRNIAEKIEYSPATIYLYYQNKNDIIHALHRDGFNQLNKSFQSVAIEKSPFERLKSLGRVYLQFAIENPDVYNLLFVMKEPMEHLATCQDEDWDEGDRAFDILFQTVTQCQSDGYFGGMEPHSLSLMIWSTVHGLSTLGTSGHLSHVKVARMGSVPTDDMMKYTFEAFIKVLERLKA